MMTEDLWIVANLAGIGGAVIAAWQLKIDLWKGILLGAVLVIVPLIVEAIWTGASNAGIVVGSIGFVATASAMKLTAKQAITVFAATFIVLVIVAATVSGSLQD